MIRFLLICLNITLKLGLLVGEIKLILEKIVDGYFLRTKDTKAIEGYQENLYEYKHPNGIRVLYVVEGNIIIICSLFMKDKQKSSRISNEYDDPINITLSFNSNSVSPFGINRVSSRVIPTISVSSGKLQSLIFLFKEIMVLILKSLLKYLSS